jgi:hypothetical protein
MNLNRQWLPSQVPTFPLKSCRTKKSFFTLLASFPASTHWTSSVYTMTRRTVDPCRRAPSTSDLNSLFPGPVQRSAEPADSSVPNFPAGCDVAMDLLPTNRRKAMQKQPTERFETEPRRREKPSGFDCFSFHVLPNLKKVF